MKQKRAYLVVDIGTGNIRVAVVSTDGKILGIGRENMPYHRDNRYQDAIYFLPDDLWQLILGLANQALSEAGEVHINAITATSQREGIVVCNVDGQALLGMPNIDHRGRAWEGNLTEKDLVYHISGRYPTSLFSAFKLVGLREVCPEIFQQVATFMSISDWVQYMFSGVYGYEHSQASETLLYDVAEKSWSMSMVKLFDLSATILPPLRDAGFILGPIIPYVAEQLGIASDAVVVVGGSDTQLAIHSMVPSPDDILIVSGTTTPITKLVDTYETDKQQRTWTSRHTDTDYFILEANAGVTGLNYQRLKEIFYPNEGYEVIESELKGLDSAHCMASLGSLIADEGAPVTTGGFVFPVPVSHELKRADFVFAVMWDMACSIYENYRFLCQVSPHEKPYIWACGGGMESLRLCQFLANLTGKSIRLRDTFRQSTVLGGAFLCNQALQVENVAPELLREIFPEKDVQVEALYQAWKSTRKFYKQVTK